MVARRSASPAPSVSTLLALGALALGALALTAGASGCTVPDEPEASDEDLSAASRSYVTVRRDVRKCAAPMCGGWFVSDVNRVALKEAYVSDLDVAPADLSPEQADVVRSAPDGELMLRGKLGPIDPTTNTRAFLVSEAFRGLPGASAAPGDLYYQLDEHDPPIQCFVAPCSLGKARLANKTTGENVDSISVARAAQPLVDQAWLRSRVHTRDALVAARVVDGDKQPAGVERVLDASQIFVKLPDSLGPCGKPLVPDCGDRVATFTRDEERCTTFDQCVDGGACAAYVPSCPEGYSLVSHVSAPFACNAYFCDPTWLVEAP